MKKKHTLKRYVCTDDGSPYGDSYGKPIMEDRPEGDYVKFSDIEPLIEALQFYADRENYKEGSGFSSFQIVCGEIIENPTYAIFDDEGEEARFALNKVGIK